MRTSDIAARVGIAGLAAVAGLALFASSAGADVIGAPISIHGQLETGETYDWDMPTSWGTWDASGNYAFANEALEIDIQNGSGETVLRLSGMRLEYLADPQVNLNFNVFNPLGISQTFTVNSALLTFPAISGATATASASVTVTDVTNNGASYSGLQGGGKAYRANYNGVGLVPSGTTYATLVNPVAVAAGSGTGVGSAVVGPDPLPGSITSMASQWKFSLSGTDGASGTSTFEVIPSPAGLALLGLGGLVAARRRRA